MQLPAGHGCCVWLLVNWPAAAHSPLYSIFWLSPFLQALQTLPALPLEFCANILNADNVL